MEGQPLVTRPKSLNLSDLAMLEQSRQGKAQSPVFHRNFLHVCGELFDSLPEVPYTSLFVRE